MEKFVTLKKIKRQRKHGFRARLSTHGGKLVLKRRIRKQRSRLSI